MAKNRDGLIFLCLGPFLFLAACATGQETKALPAGKAADADLALPSGPEAENGRDTSVFGRVIGAIGFGSKEEGDEKVAAAEMDAICAGDARYTATFNAAWSRETHPLNFPMGAHFSPPVAVAHGRDSGFWAYGNTASPGVAIMARTGKTDTLRNEIEALTGRGLAAEVAIGNGFQSPGSGSIEVTATPDFPYLTYATMIAPSPDWFVGVEAISLCGSSDWVETITIDLFALDAGSDDGVTFRTEDVDSDPKQPISLLSEMPQGLVRVYGRTSYGKLVVSRIDAAP
ncbi:MAG: spondin domain-containing protein [Alphaproteobacteria bacterium]|nr:spondin domain-containing protein [Alphaproteobacteria bacterium]